MEQLKTKDVIDHCERKCERYEKFSQHIENCKNYLLENNKYYAEHYYVKEWLQELQRYKELEEQGLLLKLPCKVGDEFWELNDVNEPFIYPRKALTIQHCVYVLERLGKKAFLTKAEAEKALKEMKGK